MSVMCSASAVGAVQSNHSLNLLVLVDGVLVATGENVTAVLVWVGLETELDQGSHLCSVTPRAQDVQIRDGRVARETYFVTFLLALDKSLNAVSVSTTLGHNLSIAGGHVYLDGS